MPLTTASVLGPLLAVGKGILGLVWPKYKILSAARRAGAHPDAVNSNELRQFLAQSYREWFVPDADAGSTGLKNKIIRSAIVPEFLTTPSAREWLKRTAVQDDFLLLAEMRLQNAQGDTLRIRDRLAAAYASDTFDDNTKAHGPIDYVVGMLCAATNERFDQSGKIRIGLAQSLGAQHSREHQEIKVAINEVSSKLERDRSAGVVLHHSEDARDQLAKILVRRAVLSAKIIIQQLNDFLADLEPSGRLSGASSEIQVHALYWLFRLMAAKGENEEANKVRTQVLALDPTCDVRIPDAWLAYHSGNQSLALQKMRAINTPDGRSSLFAMLKTADKHAEAMQWVESTGVLAEDFFTGIGWRNYSIALAENGQSLLAINLISTLGQTKLQECPYLIHILGILHSIQIVVPERQKSAFYNGLWDAGEFIQTKEAYDHLQQAIECFKKAKLIPDHYMVPEVMRETTEWLTWVRLLHPQTAEVEKQRIKEALADPDSAVEALPFAVQFDLEFEVEPIERYLEQQEVLGGLTNEQFQARFLLTRRRNKPDEIAKFIEDNFDRLTRTGNEAGLTGFLIQSLAAAGLYEKAEEVLSKKRDRLYPADVARFEAQIISCKGGDPIEKLIENYNRDEKSYVDLVNLVHALRQAKRWSELAIYAHELYNKIPNIENAEIYIRALRALKSDHNEAAKFCSENIDIINQSDELRSIYAWSLFWIGETERAKSINDDLVFKRHQAEDIGLEINIALKTGEWSHFNTIMEREWEGRAQLPNELLLNLAALTANTDSARAFQLCKEVSESAKDDPETLVRVHHIAVRMGKDDFAMPLIYRAAELSKEDGPVKSFATREMLSVMSEQAEEWHRKVDLIESGKVPLHIAAAALNVPLSHFFLKVARSNEVQLDGRSRGYVAVQSGKRKAGIVTDFSSIGLDVTSVFLLAELKSLDDVLSAFEKVYLSPRFMEFLFHEIEQVRYHQPSRIAEAKSLIEFVHDKKIGVIECDPTHLGSENQGLAEEVGDELAFLMAEAKKAGGYFVHIGPIYKQGSYLEVLADVSPYSATLTSPHQIAAQMVEAGLITENVFKSAADYLGKLEKSISTNKASGDAPLFLDDDVLPALHKTGLLNPLVQSGRKIYVLESQYDMWKSFLKLEGSAESLVASLNELRRTILQNVKSGKIRWLPQSKLEEDIGRLTLVEAPIYDMIASAGEAGCICIDDAFLNKENGVTDKAGQTARLVSSIDIFGGLVAKKIWPLATYMEKLHTQRIKGFGATPISVGELIARIKDRPLEGGEIKESAELISIRQSIALFHLHTKRKSKDDLNYMDALWQNGYEAIRFFWLRNEADATDAATRANWIFEHVMPDLETAFPLDFGPDRAEKMLDVGAKRLLAFLVPDFTTPARNKSYKAWLEAMVLPAFSPLFPELREKAVQYLAEHIISWSSELANEHEKRSR